MKTHDAPKRSPGEPEDLAIHGRPAPYQTGVLPKDFVQRLNRLKKASGLTWNGLARALGVDKKQPFKLEDRDENLTFPPVPEDLAIDGRPAPYQTGVLPKDFVQRLNRLKKASGLTWNGLARALGVDKKQPFKLEDRDENP